MEVFLVVVGFFAIAIPWSIWRDRVNDSTFADAAKEMGLSWDEASALPRMSGRIRGFDVAVSHKRYQESRSTDSVQATAFEVHFPPQGPEVIVTASAGWADERSVKRADLEIGDPEFDHRFRIRAEAVEDARSFLTTDRKDAIRHLFETMSGGDEISVRNNGIVREEFGAPEVRADRLARRLDELIECAEVLCRPNPGPETQETESEALVSPEAALDRADEASSDRPDPEGGLLSSLRRSLVFAASLALVSAMSAAATLWLLAPWGPMWTENGVVTEIDRSITRTPGQRSPNMNYDVYITSESGTEFKLDSPELSAYAEVGQEVVVERSAWTDSPMRARVEEGAFGRGGGFGLLFRAAGLLAVAGVAGLSLLVVLGLVFEEFPFGLLSPIAVIGGAWSGSAWVLG